MRVHTSTPGAWPKRMWPRGRRHFWRQPTIVSRLPADKLSNEILRVSKQRKAEKEAMVDALASGLPVAQDHLQVLERLRQLTAWQQAQQERLRRHQQEQIARLRSEQERLGGQPAAGLTPVEHSYATAHPDRVQPQSLAGPALSHRQLSPTPACTLHPTPPTVAARDEERDSSVRQLAPDHTVSDQSLEDHEGAPSSHGGGGAREVAVGGRGCEASSDSGLGTGGQGSEEGSLTACSDESSLASEKEVEQFPTLGEREGGGGVEKPSLDVSCVGHCKQLHLSLPHFLPPHPVSHPGGGS